MIGSKIKHLRQFEPFTFFRVQDKLCIHYIYYGHIYYPSLLNMK